MDDWLWKSPFLNFFSFKCQHNVHDLPKFDTRQHKPIVYNKQRCIIYNQTLAGNQFPLEHTQYTGYIPGSRQVWEGFGGVVFVHEATQVRDMTQLIGIQCCTLWHVNSLEHMKTFPQEIIYNHFVNVASSNKKIYYKFYV